MDNFIKNLPQEKQDEARAVAAEEAEKLGMEVRAGEYDSVRETTFFTEYSLTVIPVPRTHSQRLVTFRKRNR